MPRLADRLRATLVYIRCLPGQRRVPFLPEEQIQQLADARARAALAYAATWVPYYRELFGRAGIDARELDGISDIRGLPLLEKSAIRDDPGRFRSGAPAATDGLALRTTGSTWEPLTVHHDRRSLLENIAYAERERAVESSFIGRELGYVALDFGFRSVLTTPREVRSFYDRACYRPFRPQHHHVGVDEPLDVVVATINRLRPEVVRGYGTYLELFFRTVAARELTIHRPRVAVYTGDGMTEEGRKLIEASFGVPVLSQYSAVEVFRIGFFCEERNAHHIHEDLCDLSIVDSDGRQLPDGVPGEVVVSNLVNRGTVILNYRLGDVARIIPGRCSCGRSSRLLSMVEGRISEIVYLADGSFVHPFAVWATLKFVAGVLRYQLVQREPTRFELRLVTVDRTAYDEAIRSVVPALRETLRGAAVEPSHHVALEPEPGRKFQAIVALPRQQVTA